MIKTCFPVLVDDSYAKIMALDGKLEINAKLLHGLGFKGIELMFRNAASLPVENIREILSQNGLAAAAIGVTPMVVNDKLTLASSSREVREFAASRARDAIDLAAALSAPFCIGSFRGSIGDSLSENSRTTALDTFKELCGYAKERHVNVLVEPQTAANGNYLNSVGEVLDWIELIGTGNVKLILDLFHMDACERSIFGALQASSGMFGLVHLTDSKRLMIGFGSLPVCEFVSAILATGYDGFFSVEVQQIPDGPAAARMSGLFFDYYERVILS
jgi:sugar phosphate isomerase/epimerase